MARAALLSVLVVLLCAAPASATLVPPHGDEIPPTADTVLEAATARAQMSTALAPGSWCGTETNLDDVAHQAVLGNAIKVVYARPHGATNHFADYADVIQGDIKAVADAFLAATDGVKSVRFDVGTSCGPAYVDIQSVELPHTAAEYLAMNYSTRYNTLSTNLTSIVDDSPACPIVATLPVCTRDFLVYADGLYNNDFTTGVGMRPLDDRPDADNTANLGGHVAYVLGDGSADFGYGNSSATTAEHELLHNLGAVHNTAPHSTLGGHCYDDIDVMCYPDGGSGWMSAPNACPSAPESTIDCNHDDYFNPAGQIIGTGGTPIWNVYDSDFLCPADACGSGGPTITSTPTGGGTATTTTPVPQPAAPQAPPSTPVKPVKPDDPLAGLAKAWKSELRGLLAGRPVRVTYSPAQSGTFTVKLMLGNRVVASASARARAGKRVAVTLRLSAKLRRKLAPQRSRLKFAFAVRR